MRHVTLISGALIQLGCLFPVSASLVQEVGEWVAAKTDGKLEADGKIVERLLAGTVMEVRKVEGDRLWVTRWASGWIPKADVLSIDDAVDHFTQAIRENPANATYYIARGNAWVTKEEPDKALADYTEALRLDPKSARAYLCRGRAWIDKDELEKAISDYDEAIRLDSKYAEAYLRRGYAWAEKGEYDKAIADYDEVIRLDPKCVWAYIGRGDVWDEKGEYDKAIADLTEAIRLDPENSDAYCNRAIAHAKNDDYDASIRDFNEAIRLEPEDADLHFNRGRFHDIRGDYAAAVRDLSRAIELGLDSAEVYAARATAYQSQGEHDKAIADFLEAIRLDPKHLMAHATLGEAYEMRGQREKAIPCYTEAIRLFEQTPDELPKLLAAVLYNNRGYARYQLGELDLAIADYTKAVEIDRDYDMPYLNRGNAYGDKKMFDEAVADYTEAIRCVPDNSGGYFCRGHALFMSGKYDEAIEDYTKVIQLDPQNAEGWCNRGSARMKKRQYDKALADYDRALQLDPRDPIAIEQKFVAAANVRLKKQGDLPTEDPVQTEPAPPKRKVPQTDEEEDGNEETPPPCAQRVAARAIVLSAITYRAHLEDHADSPDSEPFRRKALAWLDSVGLASELEQKERKFLETPVGKAERQTVIDGHWRSEGLAVLAWALKRYGLPAYDEGVDIKAAADAVGFLDTKTARDLLRSAEVRAPAEISLLAAHTTIVHWRLRQFNLAPGPMDYNGYLRQHPFSKPYWHDNLRFVDGDLAIGESSVSHASEEDFETCRSTAVERQVAAYWLQGECKAYSGVDASTILSGL